MNEHGTFALRRIGLLVVTFVSTSCSSWQPVTANVPDRVRLTTTDSQRIELRRASTLGDSVIVGVASDGQAMRFPRDSVLTIEGRVPPTLFAIVAGTAAGFALFFAILLSAAAR